MDKMQRVLIVLFVFFLIIGIAELGYYLYLIFLPRSSSPVTLDKSAITNLLANVPPEKKALLDLIPKAKAGRGEFTNGVDYLRQPGDKKCFLALNCLEIDNKENYWLDHKNTAPSSPILLNGPFLVRLSLINKKDIAGISLSGEVNDSSLNWWENIKVIFIGLGEDNTRLYLDARNGSSLEPIHLLDKLLPTKISLLNLFFDKSGQHLLITNENYEVLDFVDINELSAGKFPNGIFINQKVYLGYGIAPKSYLGLLEFKIIPLSD